MAASGGRAPGFADASALPARSGNSILWPMTVVGGSIAIAAFGVLGLYLLGNSDRAQLVAGQGAPDPANAIGSSLPAQARSMTRQTTFGTDLQPLVAEDGSEGAGRDENTAVPTTVATDRAGEADASSVPTTTTAPATTEPARSSTSVMVAPPQKAETEFLVGPALYANRAPNGERLASVVVTDHHLITSASALGNHSRVFLMVDGRYIEASVAHRDPASDVAIVVTADDSVTIDMPLLSMVTEPVMPGADAYLGYCLSEMPTEPAADAPAPAAGSTGDAGRTGGDNDAGDDDAADRSEPAETTVPPIVPQPGCGNGEAELQSYALPPSPETTEPPVQAPEFGQPSTGWETGREAESAPAQRSSDTVVYDPRAGTVYSTDVSATTLFDRTVYRSIQTNIQRPDGSAGAPLRDVRGRLVGVVLGSRDYHVSALPIERVMTIADSLIAWGVGHPAWIGIDGQPSSVGFVIDQVDENGPAAETLEPGDVLVTVNGERLQSQDHLTYLIRELGVGRAMTMSYLRQDEGRLNAEIVVGNQLEN